MTDFTPEVDLTIFPRINFLKTFEPRLEQRDMNGRVYWIDGAPSPFDDATLHLNFAESKSLTDDVTQQNLVTFTRASTGTYTDNAGVIQTAAVDEPRFDHSATGESLGLLIEEARTNLVTRSENISDAYWTKQNLTAVLSSNPAPTGTLSAYKLTATAPSAAVEILPSDNTNERCLSVFISKTQTCRYAVLYGYRNNNFSSVCVVDLQEGIITDSRHDSGIYGSINADSTISSYGAGYYRVSLTMPSGVGVVGSTAYGVGLSSVSTITPNRITDPVNQLGDATGEALTVWGFQLETGAFPTSYIPTLPTFTSRASTATYYDASGVIQTAGVDVARDAAYLPDENGVFRPVGLLAEGARTNLQFPSIPVISDIPASITPNAATAPDGTITATFVEPTGADGSGVRSDANIAKTATYYAHSFFYKPNGYNVAGINYGSGNPDVYAEAWIDVTTGASYVDQTFISISKTSIGNGWYRISAIQLVTVAGTSAKWGKTLCPRPDVPTASNQTFTHTPGSGGYFWGHQEEEGAFCTSYIPTTTATVTRAADVTSSSTATRAADVASITGTNFSSWYNQSEGTMLCEYRTPSTEDNALIWGLNGATDADRIAHYLRPASGGDLRFDTTVGGTFTSIITVTNPRPDIYRTAVGIAPQNIKAVLNGGTLFEDTGRTGNLPTVTQFFIGTTTVASAYFGVGHVSRIAYFPTRLPDSELQDLTS